MGPSPNLSVIRTVTFGTMLNLNGSNSAHGLKTVTCKQTLRIGFSCKFETIRDSGNIAQQQARVSKGVCITIVLLQTYLTRRKLVKNIYVQYTHAITQPSSSSYRTSSLHYSTALCLTTLHTDSEF